VTVLDDETVFDAVNAVNGLTDDTREFPTVGDAADSESHVRRMPRTGF
jgi:hypothetical protein